MSKKNVAYQSATQFAIGHPDVRKKLVYYDPSGRYHKYTFYLGKRGTSLGAYVYAFACLCLGDGFERFREMYSSNGLTVAKSFVDHHDNFTIQDEDGSVIYC